MAHRTYDRRIMIAMTAYVIVLLAVWPLAKQTAEPLPKIGYALLPVLPLLYVIWTMAQKILGSDELEQRTHLIGLGVAAATISIIGLVSGFLAAAGALTLDATSTVLIWIFPLTMAAYGAACGIAARRYGSGSCDEDERMPMYLRALWVATLLTIAAVYSYFRGHADAAGILFGMALASAALIVFLGIRRRRAASAE
jgi:hypothetical protein